MQTLGVVAVPAASDVIVKVVALEATAGVNCAQFPVAEASSLVLQLSDTSVNMPLNEPDQPASLGVTVAEAPTVEKIAFPWVGAVAATQTSTVDVQAIATPSDGAAEIGIRTFDAMVPARATIDAPDRASPEYTAVAVSPGPLSVAIVPGVPPLTLNSSADAKSPLEGEGAAVTTIGVAPPEASTYEPTPRILAPLASYASMSIVSESCTPADSVPVSNAIWSEAITGFSVNAPSATCEPLVTVAVVW